MRIRKNVKLSALLSSDALGDEALPQPHVCQLNQSPWDLLSFSSSQFEGEGNDNSLTAASTCLAEFAGVVDSIVSSMDDGDNNNEEEDRQMVYCNKTDGKRWQCKRLAKQGHSMCEHHLNQLKSYTYNKRIDNSTISTFIPKKSATSVKKVKKKSVSNGNPYEFYYYSGFGPKWGKKRSGGTRDDDDTNMDKNIIVVEPLESESQSSSMKNNDNDEIDYVDDDDDEEMEDNDDEKKKKKKMRKPVKARSLKSLL